MRQRRIAILLGALLVTFAVAVGWLLLGGHPLGETAQVHIGVIMYGSENNNRWSALEQGIRQACRDLDIESPALASAAYPSAVGTQESLIAQEVAAGASGLLVAPQDGEAMAEALRALEGGTPLVLLKSGAPGFDYVGANDADMGALLAERLAEHSGDITLLRGEEGRSNLDERQTAFTAALEAQGRTVHEIEDPFRADQPVVLRGVVVALDTDTLEKAIDFVQDFRYSVALYGIGSSDKVVHALNQGILRGVVFQNEYAIGYIATQQLAEKLGLAEAPEYTGIQYMYVDQQTMFEPEAERLLFPITQ